MRPVYGRVWCRRPGAGHLADRRRLRAGSECRRIGHADQAIELFDPVSAEARANTLFSKSVENSAIYLNGRGPSNHTALLRASDKLECFLSGCSEAVIRHRSFLDLSPELMHLFQARKLYSNFVTASA